MEDEEQIQLLAELELLIAETGFSGLVEIVHEDLRDMSQVPYVVDSTNSRVSAAVMIDRLTQLLLSAVVSDIAVNRSVRESLAHLHQEGVLPTPEIIFGEPESGNFEGAKAVTSSDEILGESTVRNLSILESALSDIREEVGLSRLAPSDDDSIESRDLDFYERAVAEWQEINDDEG